MKEIMPEIETPNGEEDENDSNGCCQRGVARKEKK